MNDKNNLSNEADAPIVNNHIFQTSGPDGLIVLTGTNIPYNGGCSFSGYYRASSMEITSR